MGDFIGNLRRNNNDSTLYVECGGSFYVEWLHRDDAIIHTQHTICVLCGIKQYVVADESLHKRLLFDRSVGRLVGKLLRNHTTLTRTLTGSLGSGFEFLLFELFGSFQLFGSRLHLHVLGV